MTDFVRPNNDLINMIKDCGSPKREVRHQAQENLCQAVSGGLPKPYGGPRLGSSDMLFSRSFDMECSQLREARWDILGCGLEKLEAYILSKIGPRDPCFEPHKNIDYAFDFGPPNSNYYEIEIKPRHRSYERKEMTINAQVRVWYG